ncbi:MAG: LytR/AlgR family response regulator transcription factor [Sedimentibacter sp.]
MDNTNILIIDDDQNIINALKRILNKNEYIIYSANKSERAIDIIKNHDIDILLCDYNMPDMSGIEILKYAKDILPNAIRILITGNFDLNITISAINEVGIYYYISKPWKNEEVISIIEKAVNEKRIQEKKAELYEILNDSKDYLVQTASMLNSVSSMENNIPIKFKNSNIQNNKKIHVYEDENIVLINLSEIYYISATEGSVVIVTEKGKYKSPETLNSWGKKLGENYFFRTHRGYIVNIDKIDKISPWFNGAYNIKFKKLNETIPVSRGYMKKFREILEL